MSFKNMNWILKLFFTRCAVNSGWQKIDIHGLYSLVNINLVCTYAKQSPNVTSQYYCPAFARSAYIILWWRHNTSYEKVVHGDNDEMSDQWFVFIGFVCSEHKTTIEIRNSVWLTVNNVLVAREAIRQWYSLVTSLPLTIIGESTHSWQK